MNRRSFVAVAHLILGFLLTPLAATTSAQKTLSSSEKSYRQARRVLDAGIQALGGLGTLRAIQNITLKEVGKGHSVDQSPSSERPFITVSREETTIVDYRQGRLFVDRKIITPGFSGLTGIIIKGNEGYNLDKFSKLAAPIANPSLSNFRNLFFQKFPHVVLLEALDRAASLRWVGEEDYRGTIQNVITFVSADGRQTSLHFNARTNLLTKYDSLYTDAAVGDSIQETIFPDYRSVGVLKMPTGRIANAAGEWQAQTEYAEVQVNGQMADSLFEVPPGFEKVTVPALPTATVVSKLAPDVYLLQNVGGSNNVLFVAFNDYLLVVEAPEQLPYGNVSEGVIAKIKETVPNKPIKYLVLTHHHWDHAGGARGYIAEGATIVTTPGNKRIIEKRAAARFTFTQDALARNPRKPVIEIIENKKRVFSDDKHLVEIYDVGPEPHANEIIIAYLPKEKLVFQGDLFAAGRTLPVAQEGTIHFAKKIQELGLDVEKIVGVHGRIATIDELRTAVEKRRQMNRD